MSDWPYLKKMPPAQLLERAAEYKALSQHAPMAATREICAQLAARYVKLAHERSAEEKRDAGPTAPQ